MAKSKNKKHSRFFLFIRQVERGAINHFDIAIILILLFFLGLTTYSFKNRDWQLDKKTSDLESTNFNGQLVRADKKISIEKSPAEENLIQQWDVYENKWYGYKINYPSDWEKPSYEKAKTDSPWEYRYFFRKNKSASAGDLFSGFDVIVYNTSKTNGFTETEEFPDYKNNLTGSLAQDCLRIDGHLFEDDRFSAEEVYVPAKDDCFYPGFFYTLTRDDYIYNLVPIAQRSLSEKIDLKKETLTEFPEFLKAVESFELIDIVRPKPIPVKPVITAPKPVSYKIDQYGRMVCAKKNDKPSKSTKDKNLHLDMECCLDPDEYPNPWCYYFTG